MCFGGGGEPAPAPTVDPAAERQKAADEAAANANKQAVDDSRRKRQQKGLLSPLGSEQPGNVLAAAKPSPAPTGTALGSMK